MLFLIETSNDNFVNKFPIVTIVTLKKTEQDEERQGPWARDLEDAENHHKGDRHLFNEGDLGGLGGLGGDLGDLGGDGNKY